MNLFTLSELNFHIKLADWRGRYEPGEATFQYHVE